MLMPTLSLTNYFQTILNYFVSIKIPVVAIPIKDKALYIKVVLFCLDKSFLNESEMSFCN